MRGRLQSDRCLATELAGDLVVMNDEIAAALIAVLESDRAPEEIRARAAISLAAALLASGSSDKRLLLAAIEAVSTIPADEAPEILGDLLDSDDEDVVDAVQEALVMAKGLSEDAAGNDDDEEECLIWRGSQRDGSAVSAVRPDVHGARLQAQRPSQRGGTQPISARPG